MSEQTVAALELSKQKMEIVIVVASVNCECHHLQNNKIRVSASSPPLCSVVQCCGIGKLLVRRNTIVCSTENRIDNSFTIASGLNVECHNSSDTRKRKQKPIIALNLFLLCISCFFLSLLSFFFFVC